MSTKFGIGYSQETKTNKAAHEAAVAAHSQLDNATAQLIIIFTTVNYDPTYILPEIQSIFSNTIIIGCSTASVILPNFIDSQSICILAISSDEIKFGSGAVTNLDSINNQEAGEQLAQLCLKGIPASTYKGFMFFIDGLLQHNFHFISGLQKTLGTAHPIFGAGSSDDFTLSNTFQIYNNDILTKSAIGLTFAGDAHIGVSNQHGWHPLGKPRIIDSSHKNTILTINGKKAVSLYEEYFDRKIEHFSSSNLSKITTLYPLGIYAEGCHKFLLRNAVNIKKDGSIVCLGNIPEGSQVHIMISNKETCINAAITAAKEAKNNLSGKPAKLVIIFESVTRIRILKDKALQELKEIKKVFSEDTPIIGMYSNGEICPFLTEDKTSTPFHQNESITILAIG